MPNPTGLLAVWMEVDPLAEDDLNAWYTKEHLPERAGVPGFHNAIRYVSTAGEPKYMAVYDLDSLDVLKSEAYMALRKGASPWTKRIAASLNQNIRSEYELQHSAGRGSNKPAPNIVLMRYNVDPAHEAEFNAWHNEYLDALAAVPGALRIRRFQCTTNQPKYLAFYELENPDVMQSEAWVAASMDDRAVAMRPNLRDAVVSQAKFLEAAPIRQPAG